MSAPHTQCVEEGRTIYDNLVRFIRFSLGGNLGKVLVMLLAPLAGIGAIALRPLHLLWLNLLTDGLMGLGLGLGAAGAHLAAVPLRPQPGAGRVDVPDPLDAAQCHLHSSPRRRLHTSAALAAGPRRHRRPWRAHIRGRAR